jgi:ribosomal protein S18 acetylase RimI-like enzyme
VEVGSRRATPDDVGTLEELAKDALAELLPTRGGSLYVRREARARPLKELMDDDRALVLAGTIDDAVIGYASAAMEELRDGSRLAAVSDLYVHPEARGVGVGEALMDDLVAWATECGCIGVDAMVLPGNRETKNFFETFGLTARAIVVHRPLGAV